MFDASALRSASYNAADLKAAKFSCSQLKDAGFDAAVLLGVFVVAADEIMRARERPWRGGEGVVLE